MNPLLITTLNRLKSFYPCEPGEERLLKSLGKTGPDDEPLSLRAIYESNGLDDALWCLRGLPDEAESDVRLLVCDIVEPSLKYAGKHEATLRNTLAVARAHARGEANNEELKIARDAARAARAAAQDAARVTGAAGAAVLVSRAAGEAARAAWAAAQAAARAAAQATRTATRTARAAQRKTFEAWLDEMEAE